MNEELPRDKSKSTKNNRVQTTKYIIVICFLFLIWCTTAEIGGFIAMTTFKDQIEERIIAKAKTFPDMTVSHFEFFPVSYDDTMHKVPTFIVNLEDCLG
jgi:hypothetical protein